MKVTNFRQRPIMFMLVFLIAFGTLSAFAFANEGGDAEIADNITYDIMQEEANAAISLRQPSGWDSSRHLFYWWQGAQPIPVNVQVFSWLDQSWRMSALNGLLSWNWSSAPVNFTNTTAANNNINVWPRRDRLQFLGWLEPTHSGNFIGSQLRSFEIWINVDSIEEHVARYGRNLANVIRGTSAHELAHAVGLEDARNHNLGGSINGSLMNYNRIRDAVIEPTSFDVQSVRLLYN
ncbi:MAG: hypothetical protein FWE33_00415 [Defluviitaleaceae bacterium]|nr:hypothetical protein [Defluviitaleaceae bacterium]